MLLGEAEARLGSPSLVWERRIFAPQRYPHTPERAGQQPATMWIYYHLTAGSVCLYFSSDQRLLCYERNDIVIAN